MTTVVEMTPEWKRLRAILKDRGLKLRWVAERANLPRQQIWGILNRRYGYPATAEKKEALARALGAEVSDIWPAETEAEAPRAETATASE